MKKQTSSFLLSIAVATSIALSASPSEAQFATFPRRITGSACVQVSAGGVLKITGTDGAVYNDMPSTGSTLTVECPVLSHGFSDTTSTGPAEDLWYLDNSTSSITCTFKVEEQLSTAVNQQTQSSTGDDNGYRKMTFTPARFTDGFSHIRCTIPPRDAAGNASYIVGYEGW